MKSSRRLLIGVALVGVIGAGVWLAVAAQRPLRTIDWDVSSVAPGERPLSLTSPFNRVDQVIQEPCRVNVRIEEGIEVIGQSTLITVYGNRDRINSMSISLEPEALGDVVAHATKYITAWHLAHDHSEDKALTDLRRWAKGAAQEDYDICCATRLKKPALAVEIWPSFNVKRPFYLCVTVNWN